MPSFRSRSDSKRSFDDVSGVSYPHPPCYAIMVAHKAAVERARQGAAAGQIDLITELLVNKTDQFTVINLVEYMTVLNQHVKSFLTHLDWDQLLNDICKKHNK